MKKLLVLSLLVVAFAGKALASDGQGVVIEKLNDKKTVNRVARFLAANDDQKKDLEFVFAEADKKYKKAISKGVTAEAAAQKAMNFNLANSKVVLSREQYSKLLYVINSTIYNHATKSELLADK